jgi:hypothetical protein
MAELGGNPNQFQVPGPYPPTSGALPPLGPQPVTAGGTVSDAGIYLNLKKRPFIAPGLKNVQQLIPPTLFSGTVNQTASSTTMAVTAIFSGSLVVGSVLEGANIPAGTVVTAVPAGGGLGNYTVTTSAGFASTNAVAEGPGGPVIAISSTNPAAGGQSYPATSNQQNATNAVTGIPVSVVKSGNPQGVSNAFPNQEFILFNTIQSVFGSNVVQYSMMFSGTVLVMAVFGDLQSSILTKVNDQYVSLTAVNSDISSTTAFYSITFPEPVVSVRVDIIVSNIFASHKLGGFFTGSQTDTLMPAEIRGPRIMIIGDSVTTATGASVNAQGYPMVFAEYLGFDDVWPIGIGGTGMTQPAGTPSELYPNRLATDVFPYYPDELIVAGFFNDNAASEATMYAAAASIIQQVQKNLPNCRITFFGPYWPTGIGNQFGSITGDGPVGTRAALQKAVANANSPMVRLIDPSNLPLLASSNIPIANPQSASLTVAAAANATSLHTSVALIPGENYRLPDGTGFRVLSTAAGPIANIDSCINAQAAGTPFTQCGPCWITGKGFAGSTTGVGNADLYIISDDTHPTNQGHLALGTLLAQQWALLANT